MSQSANDRQIGGAHYQNATVQHWDIMGLYGHAYYVGNATKYLTRWRKKNGLEDLEKSLHYIDKLRESYQAGVVESPDDHPLGVATFAVFVAEQKLTPDEAYIIAKLFYWTNDDDLNEAAEGVQELIDAETIRQHENKKRSKSRARVSKA